jgi:hypothetical protein
MEPGEAAASVRLPPVKTHDEAVAFGGKRSRRRDVLDKDGPDVAVGGDDVKGDRWLFAELADYVSGELGHMLRIAALWKAEASLLEEG